MATSKVTIRPDATNANKGTERGRYMVEASLRETGAGRSILLDGDGRIIAGNKTFEAATDIGLPVRIVETDGTELIAVQRTDLDLSDPTGTARKLAYYDNRASQVGLEWDAEQLLEDITAGVDLDAMFRKEELDELLADLLPKTDADAEPQIDRAAELNKVWQVKTGDIWAIGSHRLVCGDCTDAATVAKVMQGEKAQAVVTDVPYGISQVSNGLRKLDYGDWDDSEATGVAISALRLCADIPTITSFCGDEQLSLILSLWKDRTKRTIAWVKPNPTVINGEHVFLPALELAAHGRKSGAWFGGKCVRSVWEGSAPVDRDHPTQKPTGLFSWIIELTCAPNEIIYEPFAGSGTTGIACENLGRVARLIELSPDYCAVILQRFVDAFGITGVKLG